jgi:hypothetical protein
VSLVRVTLGFIVPMLAGAGFAAVAVVLGELVDRCEFYDELEVPTPAAVLGGPLPL